MLVDADVFCFVLCCFQIRTALALKNKYKNIKAIVRKAAAEEKQQRFATGGGTIAAPMGKKYASFLAEPELQQLSSLIELSVIGHMSSFDSDKKYSAISNATDDDVQSIQPTTPKTTEPITVVIHPADPDGSFVEDYFFDDDGNMVYEDVPANSEILDKCDGVSVPSTSSGHTDAIIDVKHDAKPDTVQWNKYSANLLRTKRNTLLTTKRASNQEIDSAKKMWMDNANAALASVQRQQDELHALRLQQQNVALERENVALHNEKLKNKLLKIQLAHAVAQSVRILFHYYFLYFNLCCFLFM